MDLTLLNLDSPSETRTFEKGRFETYRVGPMTLGRATYEPGWKWSEHVGPSVGESACPVEHVGFVLQGRDAVAQVLDPGKLEYVILLHFESDENGGMDRFLEGAPDSTLACSALSYDLNLSGWNYSGRVEGRRDGEVIDLGRHKLRFLETPHVHHWDSMMLFDETTKSLFPSDLFIQPGDQPPVVTENLGVEMCGFYREVGIFAHEDPVRQVVDRIERLDPDWIHGMHGGSLTRDAFPHYARALREHPFAYEGKLLGRPLEL